MGDFVALRITSLKLTPTFLPQNKVGNSYTLPGNFPGVERLWARIFRMCLAHPIFARNCKRNF